MLILKNILGILILLSSTLAQAQPLVWTGPATGGYNEPFSMAAWMYENMADIASDPIKGGGTVPNAIGGFNVTYTGEGENFIACSSQNISHPNGRWTCQMSNNIISDGPLARRLVGYLLTHGYQNQIAHPNSGVFVAKSDNSKIMRALQYNNGSWQWMWCAYRSSQRNIISAVCSFK
jgi:hypothetical protein